MTKFDPHKNFAVSVIAAGPSPALSGTSLTLLPGQGALFPNPSVSGAFNCTVWPEGALPTVANAEIVRVTARAGDVLTIARAQEGSIAQPITAGMAIAATITSKSLTDLEAVLNGGSNSAIYDAQLMKAGAAVKRALVGADRSLGIGWLEDSTGNDVPSGGNSGDWPYELGLLIAAAHPEWTVDWHLFGDTPQDYAAPVRVQTGTAGERYMNFTGFSAGLQVQKSAVQATITGDIWVEATVALDNWVPGTSQTLIAHFGAAGQRAFRFQIAAASGKISMETCADGTTLITHLSSVAPTVANGAILTVAASVKVDNSAAGHDVKFYTSTDGGATFTQLGTTVTTAGVTSLFDATGAYEIGARQGTSEVLAGKIYKVKVRNGIPTSFASSVPQSPGAIVCPVLPEHWTQFSSTSPTTPTGAPIFSLVSGSVSGKDLVYLGDTTRIKMMLPDYALRLVFLCTSHNELGLRDRSWFSNWTTWVTNVKAWAYGAAPVITTQNPRKSPATNILDHAARREMLMALAVQLAVPVLDAYAAFLDASGATVANLINSDGIHPTLATGVTTRTGAQTWADYAYTAIFAGLGA